MSGRPVYYKNLNFIHPNLVIESYFLVNNRTFCLINIRGIFIEDIYSGAELIQRKIEVARHPVLHLLPRFRLKQSPTAASKYENSFKKLYVLPNLHVWLYNTYLFNFRTAQYQKNIFSCCINYKVLVYIYIYL